MANKEQDCNTFKDKAIIKFPVRTESEELKQESSSTYSSMSSSNFTMSCSGVDEQDEKEPSTSGCSSFLAHGKMHQKTKKKERVKEYLKELRSMVQPAKGTHAKMGTLSTLQHVLSSMRKMKEGKQSKSKVDKKFLPAPGMTEDMSVLQCDLMHTVYDSDSHESLTSESLKSSDELRIILSTTDHSVHAVSGNLRFVLGYPKDGWIGRSFDDYIHKKDLITFNSFHRKEWDSESISQDEDDIQAESKIFYFRLRKFKSLGNSGFSLRKQENYIPFQCMFSLRKMTVSEVNREGTYSSSGYEEASTSGNSGSSDPMIPSSPEIQTSDSDKRKLYTILYCVPLVSPYSGSSIDLPEVRTFETRHTLFCSYCHIQPNTIPLLGYLPQEMIGASIFDFYHNDELGALYRIYQKVISLKGVPYRSNPIRFRAKNGAWISCVTEWSSFVNPWAKRLEFIIGKHTVIKGPEHKDVFSENFHMPTLEETPEATLKARQKIKDLLLQPVETVYVGSSPSEAVKGKEKTVAINDKTEVISKYKEPVLEPTKHETIFPHDLEKTNLHPPGLIFRTASIKRAYDQLNYTNCIKNFLMSQSRTLSEESDIKKTSSDDSIDPAEDNRAKDLEKWLHNFDNISPGSIHMTSVDSKSLPALNNEYWKKTIMESDTEFDFDISVPKPPSFGSSTKVLVSEQEHRDNENSLDPMGIREILQILPNSSHSLEILPPSSPKSTISSSSGDNSHRLNLTRETLSKHTLLQEQLYLATASPDRNIVFISESRTPEKGGVRKQRQSLKRSHSPELSSTEPCKSGRHSEDRPNISTVSVLNPTFPLMTEESRAGNVSPQSQGSVPVSVHILPIVTSCQTASPHPNVVYSGRQQHARMARRDSMASGQQTQQLPYFYTDVNQMIGFQQSSMLHTGLTNNSMPIPVQQLNSYIMQQASYEHSLYGSALNLRKKQDREKTKIQQNQSSTEESSTEDATSSSLYLLESENKVKMAYHDLIMQSLTQQMSPQSNCLCPAPWLENICFTDNLQLKYHMPKTKHKRQLKKDREVIEKLVQPQMVLDQLDQLFTDMDNSTGPFIDEELDYVLFPLGESATSQCKCAEVSSCGQCCSGGDHGITEALKQFRKSNKKEKRSRKPVPQSSSSSSSSMAVDLLNVKIGVIEEVDEQAEEKMDLDFQSDEGLSPGTQSGDVKSKPSSCSSKSDLGEGNIGGFDAGSDSLTSSITCSELQRSHNENGSSLKESDGDAMSKKSDSSSDKQHVSSESESEFESVFSKLFTTLDICFPHLHKDSVPWLLDVNFTDEVKMQYQVEVGSKESTLKKDYEKLQSFSEPMLINEQFSTLLEDIQVSENNLLVEKSNPNPTHSDMDRGDDDSVDAMSNPLEEILFNEKTFMNLFTK